MALLHTLIERTGMKYLPRQVDEEGKRHYLGAVSYTSEFRRIEQLSRRQWDVEPLVSQLADFLTGELKTPAGTMKLWRVQAAALAEIAEVNGAFCPVGVGDGKTLISLLAPVMVGAQRPLLLVPAALRDKTLRYDLPFYSKHWKIPANTLSVVGYSEISLEKNADLLEAIAPDLIIFDECHYLRRHGAGRTRRVVRYLRAHPDVYCVALSGTVTNRSLKEWSHIVQWCLRDAAPLPAKWQELTEWSMALDADVPDEQRPLPGALKKFCLPGETPRDGFRRRLIETPGIVATKENKLGTALRIFASKPAVPREIWRAIDKLRNTWQTPNGDELINAVDVWRHARELALGFYYRWDPAPPKDWMAARAAWKRYVREVLKHNRRGLDTELQVWNESAKAPHREWADWQAIKDIFKPNSVAEWISGFALAACAEWLNEPGICWVEHIAFGERLAEYSGRHYYGAGANEIIDTKETSIVASIAAHSEGKNLQRFSRNLVTSPMTTGKAWEQLLGRTHREGQQADEVTCEVFLHFDELRNCFETARRDARYIEGTFGARQRLNFVDTVVD